GRIRGRFDPPAIRPAAQGVRADPQQARSLLDPERRHAATLTQVRQQTPITDAFTSATRSSETHLCLSKGRNSARLHPRHPPEGCTSQSPRTLWPQRCDELTAIRWVIARHAAQLVNQPPRGQHLQQALDLL